MKKLLLLALFAALVGVISECVEGFGLLRIATLENAIIQEKGDEGVAHFQ